MASQTSAAIVHVGYHKTASTWFQNAVYPRVANRRYIARRRVVEAFLADPAFHFDAARARERLGLAPGETGVILCEEELSGSLHTGGHAGFLSKEMPRRIAEVLPEARIVLVIRRQPEMIASCYLQYVRAGGTYGPERYLFPERHFPGDLGRPHKAPRFSFAHFEYLPLISAYQRTFGPERVHVFLYEALQADPSRFLADFGRRLGLAVDAGRTDTAARYNASYGMAAVRLARVLNLFTAKKVVHKTCLVHVPGLYKARTRLLDAISAGGLAGRRPCPDRLLGAETVAWIEARYRDSNRRLAETCGLALGEHGYPL